MSVDPTTTEGRVAIGTWAKLGHDIPGHKVLALLDALDEAEAAATRSNEHANDVEDRVLGLVERAEKAEAALDRVRELADAWDRNTDKFPQKWRDDPSAVMLRAACRDLRRALKEAS